MSVSTFGQPVNNFRTTLASAHAVNDGQLVLAAGSGALLGALPANRIFRVTAVFNPETTGEAILGIFEATSITANTLTGVTAVEGFADSALASGTAIRVRITAKSLSEIQTAVNAIEANYVTTTALATDLAAYAKLGGVAGGQTIAGDTAAAGTLHLDGTSNATEGQVYLGNDCAYFDPNFTALIFPLSSNTATPTSLPFLQQYNSGSLQFGCASGKFVFITSGFHTMISVGTPSSVPQLGFFDSLGAAKQAITGSKDTTLANLQTVVANLLAALNNYGLIADETS